MENEQTEIQTENTKNEDEKNLSDENFEDDEEEEKIDEKEETELINLDNELQDIDTKEEHFEDLHSIHSIDKIEKNPSIIINNPETEKIYELAKEIKDDLKPMDEYDNRIHSGFISTFSFGEKEFERLTLLLMRLDEVAEKVLTYRKSNMIYFPEFYAITKNLYINIKFLLNTTERKRIYLALDYVRISVIDYNTNDRLNTAALIMLEEVYSLLMNLKNFHGLGVSYEKKRNDAEKYYGKFFGSKVNRE